jgi:hypothetical protein
MKFVLKLGETDKIGLKKVLDSYNYEFGLNVEDLDGIVYDNLTVHLFVKENLYNQKIIYIPEVIEHPILMEYLILTEPDERFLLETYKKSTIIRLQDIISSKISKIHLLDISNYLLSLIEILTISKKIINDENKEDVFIDIISEDEDGEKIEILKRYVEAKEKYQEINSLVISFYSYKNKINNAETFEECTNIEAEFKLHFN